VTKQLSWNELLDSAVNGAVNGEVGHVIPGKGFLDSEGRGTVDSVLDNLISDGIDHRQISFNNLVAGAIGTAMGTAMGDEVTKERQHHTVKSSEKKSNPDNVNMHRGKTGKTPNYLEDYYERTTSEAFDDSKRMQFYQSTGNTKTKTANSSLFGAGSHSGESHVSQSRSQRQNHNSYVAKVSDVWANRAKQRTQENASWVSQKEDNFGPFTNEKASHLAPSFLRDLEDIWEDGAPMAVRLHQEMHLAVETGIENLGFGNLDKDARDIASIHGFNAKSYITGIFSGHLTNAITTPSGRFGRDTSQLLVGMFGIVGGGESGELDSLIGGEKLVSRLSPNELEVTHPRTMGRRAFGRLVQDIKENGINEPVKFIEHEGKNYVVDGNHRLGAARALGMDAIPVEKVQLPYLGYKTIDDLDFYSPGFLNE